MRAAVRGWSPVIMITRMPARVRLADGHAASSRGGSMMPTVPTKIRSLLERRRVGVRGSSRRVQRPVGHGQRAQRVVGQRVHIGQQLRAQRGVERNRRPCPRGRACNAEQHVGRALGDDARARRRARGRARCVDIILRSEVNGISPMRSKRRSRRAVGARACARPPGRPPRSDRPGFPSAAVVLAQVGIAGQAAAAQHDDLLVAQGGLRPARCRRARPGPRARSPRR